MIPTIFILKKLLIIFFIRLISWLNMQICKSQDEEIILQRKEGKKKKLTLTVTVFHFPVFTLVARFWKPSETFGISPKVGGVSSTFAYLTKVFKPGWASEIKNRFLT